MKQYLAGFSLFIMAVCVIAGISVLVADLLPSGKIQYLKTQNVNEARNFLRDCLNNKGIATVSEHAEIEFWSLKCKRVEK